MQSGALLLSGDSSDAVNTAQATEANATLPNNTKTSIQAEQLQHKAVVCTANTSLKHRLTRRVTTCKLIAVKCIIKATDLECPEQGGIWQLPMPAGQQQTEQAHGCGQPVQPSAGLL